jgi:hypothetical protein
MSVSLKSYQPSIAVLPSSNHTRLRWGHKAGALKRIPSSLDDALVPATLSSAFTTDSFSKDDSR